MSLFPELTAYLFQITFIFGSSYIKLMCLQFLRGLFISSPPIYSFPPIGIASLADALFAGHAIFSSSFGRKDCVTGQKIDYARPRKARIGVVD